MVYIKFNKNEKFRTNLLQTQGNKKKRKKMMAGVQCLPAAHTLSYKNRTFQFSLFPYIFSRALRNFTSLLNSHGKFYLQIIIV